MQQRHYLSDIDPAARTATCSICGPTGIKRRPPKTPGGPPWYRCRTSYDATPSTVRNRTSEAEAERKNLRWKLTKYGITLAELNALTAMQAGCCAICERAAGLCIDHDHETGKVRGLLCDTCNRAIGLLGDTVQGLEAALNYLLHPPAKSVEAL